MLIVCSLLSVHIVEIVNIYFFVSLVRATETKMNCLGKQSIKTKQNKEKANNKIKPVSLSQQTLFIHTKIQNEKNK